MPRFFLDFLSKEGVEFCWSGMYTIFYYLRSIVMPLNVRDTSSVGQSWFIKTKVKKTNYIYDGGEDYFFV